MAYFTTRVELHNANENDYTSLHEAMGVQGFSRTIHKKGEPEYHLPTAEYNKSGDFAINDVLASAKLAASATKRTFEVLVTQSEIGRAWHGLRPVR
jgi:hypothetical protein